MLFYVIAAGAALVSGLVAHIARRLMRMNAIGGALLSALLTIIVMVVGYAIKDWSQLTSVLTQVPILAVLGVAGYIVVYLLGVASNET